MDTAPRVLTRARHYARRPVANAPYVWDALMLARSDKRETLARPGTALVIEGFPRSGNTFASAAFLVANGPDVHLGRHLHGAGHLLRAARLGIPAVALVRNPKDAVLSYVIRRDQLTVTDGLIEYSDFYRTAWRARGSFVVGRFETVTSDFGAVIEAVNARFGTAFRRYRGSEHEGAALDLVEAMNREECGGVIIESQVGRPSAERLARHHELERLFDSPAAQRHLARATDWYRRFCALPTP